MKNISLRNIIPVLGIVFFYACSSKSIPNSKGNFLATDSEVNTEILKFHEKLNMDSLLNSYNKSVSNLNEELIIPLDTVVESDSSRVVVVGKFINEKDVFAIDIYGTWDKQYVDFYKYDGTWQKLNSNFNNEDVLLFSFENLNTDEDAEIKFFGHSNMNGNRTYTIFKFDSNNNQFVKSGSFFCGELNYDTKSNFLSYDLEGSWYTPRDRSIFRWSQNKIIPHKTVILELKKYDYKSHKQWISYYENPTQDNDTLVLKFKKTYREKNKKLYNLWENFFENK
jgi:hypothetical protein